MKIVRKAEVFEPHRLTLGDLRNVVRATESLPADAAVDVRQGNNQHDGASFTIIITETQEG